MLFAMLYSTCTGPKECLKLAGKYNQAIPIHFQHPQVEDTLHLVSLPISAFWKEISWNPRSETAGANNKITPEFFWAVDKTKSWRQTDLRE